MNFTNVKLILAREVRDQLRDRRTLFMIFVLPVLLYPLLGSAYFQMVQFQTQRPMSVLVVGGGQLAKTPTPLIDGDSFASGLFADNPKGAALLKLEFAENLRPAAASPEDMQAAIERLVKEKKFDAALVFPPDFAQRLDSYRKAIQDATARARNNSSGTLRVPSESGTQRVPDTLIPRPKIIYTAANERSLTACTRLTAILDRWTDEVGKANLVAGGLPAEAVKPFEVVSDNLGGDTATKSTNLWSRMLPVLMLLWAMTGAFYPAIDLCAGEKERGTLETLLSSPAERSEIVLGKLLTIMAFSMVTAALNLLCVCVTGGLVFRQMAGFGGPPPLAALWLALALVPVSALFSALCLALASFARSTKEGQYYLMPLMMLSMPLVVLPMAPGVELSLGNALVPVSGIVLLLKALLEGAYHQALQFLPIVLAITFLSCWLAVRWAVEQFNSESVLFRESERFSVGLWFRHLRRDRGPLPTAAEALFCGVVILVVNFVFSKLIAPPQDFADFARIALAQQLAVVLAPALIMSIVLTSSPRQTLLLKLPRWRMAPAAAALALSLHPFVVAFGWLVVQLYPLAPQMKQALDELPKRFATADTWLLLLCTAAIPAICEELAFRGFILSGLRRLGNSRRAVVISAIFFGISHGLLQQEISAFVLGLLLGFLAVRCGSILPGMIFHFLHNSMTVLAAKITPDLIERFPFLGLLVHPTSEGPSYQWPVYLIGGVASLALLGWFTWFPEARTADELLQEAFASTDTMEGATG
jgi:sodium transport system permease protein